MSISRLENLIFAVVFLTPLISYAQLFQTESLRGNELYMPTLVEQVKDYNTSVTQGGKQLAYGFNLGLNVEFGKAGNGSLRFYITPSVVKNISKGDFEVLLGAQSDLILFRGGLGASALVSERSRFLLEWRIQFEANFGFDDKDDIRTWGRPLFPNIGDAVANLYDPLDYSVSVGTVFINGINHGRNQQIGFFQIGALALDGYYMNDGPPFAAFGFGDSFDRFWTGVGGVGLYYLSPSFALSNAEVRYSRYTGEEPLIFELSSKLRLDYLPHKSETEQFFNKGRYQYRLGFYGAINFGFSIYQPEATDVQALIHWGTFALHSDPTSRFFTGSFSYTSRYFQLLN